MLGCTYYSFWFWISICYCSWAFSLGVCCTNPCEQLSGEISTHLVPQLGLGDEIFHHTILFSAYLFLVLLKITRLYCFESFSKGAPFWREGFDIANQEERWAFHQLGFTYRCSTIILTAFPESYHHQTFRFRLGQFGGKEDVPPFCISRI